MTHRCREKELTDSINMFNKFIKQYTPFICAIVSIVHIFLYIDGYRGSLYGVLNNLTGHSVIVILFILYHSRRMCKWYKLSCWMLILIHVSNILYHIGFVKYDDSIFITLLLSIVSLMFSVIFIATKRISNSISRACKHSETE